MTPPARPIAADWLALRRPADEAARALAAELLELVTDRLGSPLTVVDLGSGTGANRAYLEPRLAGADSWVLVDHDPALLLSDTDPESGTVRVLGGVEMLSEILATHPGPVLVTCSALLDLLSYEELDGLVAALATHRVPALLSLTVDGTWRLDPPHPHDDALVRAFNAHQARDDRPGPEAGVYVADRAAAAGLEVHQLVTPWRLGSGHATIVFRLLTERAEAAVEQQPDLADVGDEWLATRLEQLQTGRLEVEVGHVDLAVLPAD